MTKTAKKKSPPKKAAKKKSAKKKGETKKPKPIDKLHAEHLAKVREQNRRVDGLFNDWARAKEEAKDAKDAYEDANSALRELIRRDPNQRELFDTPEKEPELNDKGMPTNWADVRMDQIKGITPALVKKLAEGGIKTLGDNSKRNGEPLTKVKGIGRAAADKIEDAFDEFWKEHPYYAEAE